MEHFAFNNCTNLTVSFGNSGGGSRRGGGRRGGKSGRGRFAWKPYNKKTCYKCRKEGHIMKDCPVKNTQSSEKVEVESANNNKMALGGESTQVVAVSPNGGKTLKNNEMVENNTQVEDVSSNDESANKEEMDSIDELVNELSKQL